MTALVHVISAAVAVSVQNKTCCEGYIGNSFQWKDKLHCTKQ